ncbi:MAG: Ig-like domain-containing protein [Lachnospiraceae bacterium]|nr:Ig-like domain-containing protein [Lachnospiraceae bacterium]
MADISDVPDLTGFDEDESVYNKDDGGSDDISGGGYRELPDERNVAFIPDSVEYSDICNALQDDDEYIRPDRDRLTSASRDAAESTDSAYPYAYTEQDELLDYLKTHFPNTRTQAGEGACWAFSVIGSTELYMISHDLTDMTDPGKDPKDVDYSELHLAYWTYADEGTPSIAGDTGDKVHYAGSDIIDIGGNAKFAVDTLMQLRGVAQESVAKYSDVAKVTKPGSEIMAGTERENCAYLKNAYKINKANRDLAKQVITANGALGVSFCKYNSYINYDKGAVCGPTNKTNHAVVIVGWDDDYPKENFNANHRPENNGAWLCRNSYSTDVKLNNLNSYFWLSYEDGSIPCYWVYEMMGKDDPYFDNSYFYDSEMHWITKMYADKSANIYRANSEYANETLRAVSFDIYSDCTNVGYTVDIYTGIKDPASGPVSGTKRDEATTTGTLQVGGTYTITLKEPVVLNKGEYYSVVVTLSNGMTVNFEDKFDDWEEEEHISSSVSADAGQSFISQSGKWYDMGQRYKQNLIIHALTSNGTKEGRLDIDKKTLEFADDDAVGDTKQLTATAFDFNGKEETADITWESSDENVVTVDDTGRVTAKNNGTAKVTASAGTRIISCDVSVNLKEWTVRLDCNGGSIKHVGESGEVVYYTEAEYTVINGGEFTLPVPSRPRASFDKWRCNDKTYTDVIKVTDDIELTAQWNKPKITNLTAKGNNDHGDKQILYFGDRIILDCDVEEASIYYSFTVNNISQNGWQLYTTPIPVTVKEPGLFKFYAYAKCDDYEDSEVKEFTFVIRKTEAVESIWGDIKNVDDRGLCGTDEDGYPIIPSGMWISTLSYDHTVPFTGSNATFDGIRVYNGNTLLEEEKDYIISYSNNKNASTAKKYAAFTVKGIGGYSGSIKKEFTVTPADLAAVPAYGKGVQPDAVTISYMGKAVKPSSSFYWNDMLLNPVKDYNVECYRKSTYNSADDPGTPVRLIDSAGDYVLLLKGKGNFTGKKEIHLSAVSKISVSKAKLSGFAKTVIIPSDPGMAAKQPLGLKLTYGGNDLIQDTDYSIEYKDNDKPGKAYMIVTGKGDYADSFVKAFTVSAIHIKNASIQEGSFSEVITPDKSMLVSHKAEQAGPVLVCEGHTLVKGVDYTIRYKNNTGAGKASMIVTGEGRYKGSLVRAFSISAIDMTNPGAGVTVRNMDNPIDNRQTLIEGADLGSGEYRPGGSTPVMSLEYTDVNGDKAELVKGTDYIVKYTNNKARLAPQKYRPASVTFLGKGFYKGKVNCTFELMTNTLSHSAVTIIASDKVRSDKANGLYSIPVLADKDTGKKLKAGVEYSNVYTYEYDSDVLLDNDAVRHAGEPVEASDILKEGTDAVIRVTVAGRENFGKGGYPLANSYTGSISTTYRIKAGVIGSAKAIINNGAAYDYSGRPIEPGKDEIVIIIGKIRLDPTDYDIAGYENNVNIGTARVTIRGRGKYGGTQTFSFKIARTKMK